MPLGPGDYIRSCCELHLEGSFDASFDETVDAFLKNEAEINQRHLFIYLTDSNSNNNEPDDLPTETICCSLEHPSGGVAASLVFCHNVEGPVIAKHQLQCMTLPTDHAAPQDRSNSTVLQSLHLFTRQCFLPTIQSMAQDETNLQEKLRQLDVALQQTSMSTRLPHVVLEIHPVIEAAVLRKKQNPALTDWSVLLDGTRPDDDEFLNSLQGLVNDYIVQIRRLTTLTKQTPFPENAFEEIAFWNQLSSGLASIQDQLKSPGVEMTCSLLREAKRFVATLALENNTGMEQAIVVTTDVTTFLKQYPLDVLQSATTLESIASAVSAIFDHLPKMRQSRHYSPERACQLVEATTVVLKDSMLGVLEEFKALVFMDYKEYESKVHFPAEYVFTVFNERFDEWKDFMADQGRRRKLNGFGQILGKVVLHHLPLKQRLEQLYSFRGTQEQLRQVVHAILRDDEPEAIQQVEQAPRQIFASLNVLDITPVGVKTLDAALEEYDLTMDTIEERLAKLLHDKLQACRDAEDMFAVFARFNLLLTRTRVRAAVKEFQVQLISTVAEAIEKLQSKFTLKYEASAAARISRLRGIPPVAGKILWAKQMERQVQTLMERMGNVLGPNWGQQLEGRQLRKSGDELLGKLDARSFLSKWVAEWERDISSSDRLRLSSFPVLIVPEGRDGILVAKVNFDDKTEVLSKELRHLKWLGYGKDITKALTGAADEAVARFPYAVAVKTALRSYQAVRQLVTPELEPLLMPQLLEIRECVSDAFDAKLSTSVAVSKGQRVRWPDKDKMTEWVTRLTEGVTKFEERVEQLLTACKMVDVAMAVLEEIEYDGAKFQAVADRIQKSIDEMSLSGYADLESWVNVVGKRMSKVLSVRLQMALKSWVRLFRASSADEGTEEKEDDENGFESKVPADSMKIAIEIVLRNQEILATPAMPICHSMFLTLLHEYIGVVCKLQRPRSGRFEVFDGAGTSAAPSSFEDVVTMLPHGLIQQAYSAIEVHVNEAASFADQWLAYQTLWDTQVSDIAAQMGSDVDKWQVLLIEAAEARTALDSAATTAAFGPFTISFGKVQSQINLKYDSWQKELQSTFSSVLSQTISEKHAKVLAAKSRLEETVLDSASTEKIVLGVTFIQEMKQKIVSWAKEIDALCSSEKMLKQQRFVFHSDWVETSVVKGLYDSLLQVLERRCRTMDQQVPLLQARVSAEDRSASKKMSELLSRWHEEKPLRGNIPPPQALAVLTDFELDMKTAHVHQDNLSRAKDALGLEHTNDKQTDIIEAVSELGDLKEVWEAILDSYNELEKIKDTPWATVVMRKVKRSLDDLLAAMRSLPNRIRQYDPYIQFHDLVKNYISGHGLLSELKTESLKERHWKAILQRLGIRIPITDLTVGVLWEHGVISRKKDMQDILTTAQGEMAIEIFLGQVKTRWTKQELDLVLFQNRTRLIRGWDDLFATLDDHIGGLALMKSSPYYRAVREFQEEGRLWEDRLTKVRTAFDAWVDIQRQWVYLEGIFFGSSDIKAQLPSEWSRFKSVDSGFVSLMRRVASKPFAMEILNIENLQRTLERLGSLMSVIQKALGEYLAKQRSDFSRFYFLGDEDLLEIMGNSHEPGKILAHVGKMFAGIAGARIQTDDLPEGLQARLTGMVSKDGEHVTLHQTVDIGPETNVKEWLKALETGMQETLALLLEQAVKDDAFDTSLKLDEACQAMFVEWTTKFPAQIMILAAQINWSMGVDKALHESDTPKTLAEVLRVLEWKLEVMAKTVLMELPPDTRKKFEQLITELVHERDVVRDLIDKNVSSPTDFRWLYHLRYIYDPKASLKEKLQVVLSNAKFYYGFEYLGIGERLVQTPLTDRCYLTLTQALHFRMGGNPFGPAGTGKTESVKALGAALGRFVLVFNCDETFDFSAMGRLLSGLAQVGAWGCFDEFNRLEERILSAVSQQVLTIQRGLLERQPRIDLLGRSIALNENVGIFITLNPGYEGRRNLPDNLKALFRSFAMVVPDRNLIAQVMLYSQGIVTAEQLADKVVNLFLLCEQRMSKQRHYDFGLRALKTLLVSAGALKRQALEGKGQLKHEDLADAEKGALIAGACNNVLPKLVAEDMHIFDEILQETFPGSSVAAMDDERARTEILKACEAHDLVPAEGFIQKLLQLKQVLEMRHGVMVVGKSGKSAALKTLLKVLEALDSTKGEMYMIEPKATNKDRLYGSLDGTTLEWTDGVFTSLLRQIIENQRGESEKRHWIVFDGDVDPDWAENLNSVLDDNKMLTLPSGERLSIPNNVRIILEVDSLAHATPATVSRCGMVWFSDDCITPDMALQHLLRSLAKEDLVGDKSPDEDIPAAQILFLDTIRPLIHAERTSSLVIDALDFALQETHIMEPTRDRLLHTFRALLVQGILLAIEYDENHPDFPMTGEHMEKFAKRWLLHSLLWSFCGSAPWDVRKRFSDMLLRTSGVVLSSSEHSISDYRVRVDNGEYELWSDGVPRIEIESHRVAASDVVITTTDTIRHSDVISAWLGRRIPLVLCGPPGSGKTMTLTNVLQSMQGVVLANLNFSSRTTPEIILKTFTQYCSYVRRGKDLYLEPTENLGSSSWLVVFCDEINLPEKDTYGTQRVIMFMRQLVEHGGFWRGDNTWVKINRIQFVGACNPPTDAGRVEMSHRFLRHVPLLFVDFPERDSLLQIYRTFNGGMMKLFPNLKGETDAMTEAMVEVYLENQSKYTPALQPQYFYSPRELSRWVRGIYEAVVNLDSLTREELVRIWAHEGLRLFADRLVKESDKDWCNHNIDNTARRWFAGVDFSDALARPMFFTSWLSKDSRRVEREELKDFLVARLRVFYEEELDVPLVVFDEVLDHVLRIDRVLRQPMGHVLAVGDSGVGKTVLSKFVSWMNGLSIFQIKAHSRYGMDDFYDDLRGLMRRVGVEGEKVCFIFDEANVLSAGFIEAINSLLASGEVPGLFDGEEYTSLIHGARDAAARDGVILESEEEIWRHFTKIVQRNLHVVFTVNPSGGDWKNRSTTSPALFNRCVVDWFGTWSYKAMGEVGKEFTQRLDLGDADATGGAWNVGEGQKLMDKVQSAFGGASQGSLRHAVVAALVTLHQIAKTTAEEAASEASSITRTYLSPRDYLALIQNFVTCLNSRRENFEDEQLHVNAGLDKLRQTQENVAELRKGLAGKTAELQSKEQLANEKLQQMVADQNEAEKRKDEAERMSAELAKQQTQINQRKNQAQRDLDEAEPALRDAQASVRGIVKRDLDEVKNLARPPENVKLTLECVAIMMGESNIEWTHIRKILSKADFIPTILNFDADKLSVKQISLVKEKYLDGNTDLTTEAVTRSSKACGPLYKWAESQIKYSTIYNNIQPLREEVALLEDEANLAKEEMEKITDEVNKLEFSIAQYKMDYASLIRDVEALKVELENVNSKISRAESLLKSLGHESERWSKTSESFHLIMKSLIGDSLLMAAFLTYGGFFDFKTRSAMTESWKETLHSLDLDYREDLAIVESLSNASQRLTWMSQGLPGDHLSLENGVILEHGTRFPLVIDPSGQAISFLLQKHKSEKIQTTSFLDKAFMKTLAGAVRFGTTLLVENVEKIDPILNPILNKELQRTGGRTLVRIGTDEVDYSPMFKIILCTKNPAIRLTPDICSRVTLVNFTVTPDSLQSQSLSQLVRSMKPELEKQREDLLKLQGEQNVKLRELEDKMLAMISACEGSILDDNRVVEGMEFLMREGHHVEEQISKSEEVMAQVHEAVARFEPFSVICRKLFLLLESFRSLSFLYEFPAKTFMSILEFCLARESGTTDMDDAQRVELLKISLFRQVASRIARGLKTEDKIVFSVILGRLYKGDNTIGSKQVESPDDLIGAINEVFGATFPWQGRSLNHLAEVTEIELGSTTPLLLCQAPGHDVSGRVEAMARELTKELAAVAMGSAEGYESAENMLATASKRGTWVMLKNVHLCVDWLRETLVKKLQALGPHTHQDFRIFITSEINPKLPTGLLRISDKIVAEALSGIKATLSRFFSSIAKDRFIVPARNRLYLLLAWTHAVIQERLRFVPSGWSEAYEWTEADATHALDVIDSLMEGNGRQSQDPEKLPWDAIRSTLRNGVFGGRITADIDQGVLDDLINYLFQPSSFNVDFKVIANVAESPLLPEASTRERCFEWIESLPSHTPPTWIGLDSSAEVVREKRTADIVVEKAALIQAKCENDPLF
ncbi:hypothetical protein MPSEU_000032400 [Mayamaea pseudoterrestris]|nr:hypothetical protein MPSEU_000032400 [Mayamaea pseudoterrestris]